MAAALDTVAPGGRFRPRATVRNVGVAAAACGGCSGGLVVGESMVGSGGRGIGGVFGMFGWLSAALFGMCAWGAVAVHTVPYVPSASSAPHAGVVRIESRSARSGRVRVVAVDDAGQRLEAGVLTLGARAAVQFEVAAMESGDASAGLTGTGPGQGDWRLELSTELDIEARAYARAQGFLTALHDAVLLSGEVELPFFNPASDARRRSVLRVANAGEERVRVRVRGVDDAGRAGGAVTVELAAAAGGGAGDGVRDEPAAGWIGLVERARGHVAGIWRRAPGVAVPVGVGRSGPARGDSGCEPVAGGGEGGDRGVRRDGPGPRGVAVGAGRGVVGSVRRDGP